MRDWRGTFTPSPTSSAGHGSSAKQALPSHCWNQVGDGDSTTQEQLGSLPCAPEPPYPERILLIFRASPCLEQLLPSRHCFGMDGMLAR